LLVGLVVLLIFLSSFRGTDYYLINTLFLVSGIFIFVGLLGALGHIIQWWWNDAKDDGKPTDLLLCVAGSILLIPLWLFLLIPNVLGGMAWVACDVAHVSDKYFMDSPCFDFNYRCDVECSRYGLSFTGVTDGCACDCGTGWVSSCSGFYYDKESEGQNLVRITGEEVVEYPNGTSEPAGYEEGVYAFNKSEDIVIDEEHKVV